MRKVTREQRLVRAQAKANATLSIFESAALDLEEAAKVMADVASEADVEAEALLDLRDIARGQQLSAQQQATKIREFVGR